MSFIGWIKRYTTAQGRSDRELLGGALEWADRLLIPVAPNRKFKIMIYFHGGHEVTCELTTTSITHEGISAIKADVRRTADERAAFSLVLSEAEGTHLGTVWP